MVLPWDAVQDLYTRTHGPMTTFLSPSDRPLVQRLECAPEHTNPKRWVLRDDNGQNHHGIVDSSKGSVVIELSWKANTHDAPKLVGAYRLDLDGLLAAGIIRREPQAGRGARVRVRFYRERDGVIYLQQRRDRPRLAVGQVPR